MPKNLVALIKLSKFSPLSESENVVATSTLDFSSPSQIIQLPNAISIFIKRKKTAMRAAYYVAVRRTLIVIVTLYW